MRLTVERAGKSEVVEVAPDLTSVTIDGRSFPVRVVSTGELKVELEVAGERIVVENWPDHFPEPPGPVDVGGERWKVKIAAGPVPAAAASPLPPARPAATARAEPTPPPGEGVPVFPPMPGKVIDLEVREGDPVKKGDVLLHLEAMKMVNEITSPVDGIVRSLRVSAGANVRAQEPMLFVAPGPAKGSSP